MSLNAAICYALMSATAHLMFDKPQMLIYFYWTLGFAVLAVLFLALIRRFNTDLLRDVGILLYPSAAVICLFMSFLLALNLRDTMGIEDNRHLVVVFGGVAMFVSMAIRCLDIPWLLTKEELDMRLRSRSNDD